MSEDDSQAGGEKRAERGKGAKSKLLSSVGTQFLAAGMYSAFIGIVVAYLKLAGQFPKEFQAPMMWCGAGSMIVIQTWFLLTSIMLMFEKSVTDRLMAQQERELEAVEGMIRIAEANVRLQAVQKKLDPPSGGPALPPA